MSPILEAVGLHVFYGSSHVLHGVDLAVGGGEAVGLLGRNGMGKTTTIRGILGLSPPSQGEVRIRGERVTGAPAHRIARLGLALVPEGRGIFPTLTARENLVMAARPSRDGSSGASFTGWDLDGVLALFPTLGRRLGHMGDRLSGGEQQMLSIGRALMTNPDLLILDEATEGLAPTVRDRVWSVIRRIKDLGVATLIVDKDLRNLLAIADRCVILGKGQVVYAGTAEDLAAHPDIHVRFLGV